MTIFEAVYTGNLTLVKTALDRGGRVDSTDEDGRTPLMHAVIDAREDIVRFLLAHGADPNVQDRNGYSSLHFAAQEQLARIAELLLESSAQVDTRDVHGNTPLGKAVFYSEGRGEMIKCLLRAGADPNIKNEHGVSPLELANTIANYDVAQFFAK